MAQFTFNKIKIPSCEYPKVQNLINKSKKVVKLIKNFYSSEKNSVLSSSSARKNSLKDIYHDVIPKSEEKVPMNYLKNKDEKNKKGMDQIIRIKKGLSSTSKLNSEKFTYSENTPNLKSKQILCSDIRKTINSSKKNEKKIAEKFNFLDKTKKNELTNNSSIISNINNTDYISSHLDKAFSNIISPDILETCEENNKKFLPKTAICKKIESKIYKKIKSLDNKPINFKTYLKNNQYVRYMSNFFLSYGNSESLKEMPNFLKSTFNFRPPNFEVASILQDYQNNIIKIKNSKKKKKKVNLTENNDINKSHNNLDTKLITNSLDKKIKKEIINCEEKKNLFKKCDYQIKQTNTLLQKKVKVFKSYDKKLKNLHNNFYTDHEFKKSISREIKSEYDKKIGFIYGDTAGHDLAVDKLFSKFSLFDKKVNSIKMKCK